MSNLGRLYKYELKKLMKRKMLWISLVILLAVTVFMPLTQVIGYTTISSDLTGGVPIKWSHYELAQMYRADPAGLGGRPLDTELIQEAIDKTGIIQYEAAIYSFDDDNEYAVTVVENKVTFSDDPLRNTVIRGEYNGVWGTVQNFVGSENMTEELTVEDYYAAVEEARQLDYAFRYLSPDEINWWNQRAAELDRPYTWPASVDGWDYIPSAAATINLLVMLFAIITLSGVFPGERQRQVDALSMCAKNGRTPLYLAKLLASLTVSFAGAVLLLAGLLIPTLVIFGTDGFDAAIQVAGVSADIYAAPMTLGKLALICLGLCLLAPLVYAAFTLTVSLLTKGGTPTMAIGFGVMLVTGSFSLPYKWRVLSQAWDLLPSCMDTQRVLDPRLVKLFGHYLTSYQFAPILWLIMLLTLAGLGYLLHRRVPSK